MAKYYVTVADAMTQAANSFAQAQTLPDGGTLSSIKVPPGMTKITKLGVSITPDGAHTIDTGNNFTVQLSGTGMKDGIQEFNVGAIAIQEVGTSVGAALVAKNAFYRDVDVNIKPGEIVVSAAYDGTDPGSPFIAITLGFE